MEAIVAVVILAGVIVAVERNVGIGWRGVREAQSVRTGLDIARNKLAAASAAGISAGEEDGDDGRFHWHVSISPRVAAGSAGSLAPLRANWVAVAVTWRDRPFGPPRAVELKTLTLQAARR